MSLRRPVTVITAGSTLPASISPGETVMVRVTLVAAGPGVTGWAGGAVGEAGSSVLQPAASARAMSVAPRRWIVRMASLLLTQGTTSSVKYAGAESTALPDRVLPKKRIPTVRRTTWLPVSRS